MNFNEEMVEELDKLGLGGQLVTIAEEDKGTPQDYMDLEKRLLAKDIETTRMIREGARNARLGLPCGNALVGQAVELRQELTGNSYGIEELQRIFIRTRVAMCFVDDNMSNSDFGSDKRIESSHCLKYVRKNLK